MKTLLTLITSTAGMDGMICLESDDEAERGLGRANEGNNEGTCDSFNEGKDLEKIPNFSVNDKQLENRAISADLEAEKCLEKNTRVFDSAFDIDKVVQSNVHDEGEVGLWKENQLKDGASFSDSDVEHDQSLKFVVEQNQLGNGTITAGFDDCLESSPSIVSWTRQIGKLVQRVN